MTRVLSLIALAGPHRRRILGAVAWWTLENLVSVLPLAVMVGAVAWITGPGPVRMPDAGSPAGALLAFAAMAGALLLRWAVFHRGARLAYTAGYRTTCRLRIALVEHLRRLPASAFDTRDSAAVTATLMNDLALLEIFPGTVLPRLLAGLALPVVAVAAGLAVDLRLGGILAVTVLLAWGSLWLGHRVWHRASVRRSQAMGRLNSRLMEFVLGIPVIRAFGLTLERLDHARQALGAARDTNRALVGSSVAGAVLAPLVLSLGLALVLWLAGQEMAAGSLEVAGFVLYVLFGLRLVAPLQELAEFGVLTHQMVQAKDRVAALLATPSVTDPADPRQPAGQEIRFEAVSLVHGDGTEALRQVSFTAPAGGITAIVGETGAGKSTLLRLLTRSREPTGGRILIGGVDLRDLAPETLAGLIGLVSQEPALFGVSARDNIRLGRPGAGDDEVEAAARAARCHDFITALPEGYDTVLTNAGAALSGGERQRLSLARLFLKDCPILLLDEATASLDVENERLVQDALQDLARGKTVLTIAHRLWTIRTADHIVVLENGHLVEQGTDVALRDQNGAYARLWEALKTAPGWRGASARDQNERPLN